jgi:hypothetical protein
MASRASAPLLIIRHRTSSTGANKFVHYHVKFGEKSGIATVKKDRSALHCKFSVHGGPKSDFVPISHWQLTNDFERVLRDCILTDLIDEPI